VRTVRRIDTLVLCIILILGAGNPPRLTSGPVEHSKTAPSLTIYNQGFAVVRQKLPLELKSGLNHVEITDITAHLEPDSVILRPLDAGQRLQILEQNYRNDAVTQQLLLSLYEGKTIDFVQMEKDANPRTVRGKIIRSGYVPPGAVYIPPTYQQQPPSAQSGSEQPLIEVNGKLQFSLPGQPVFPALADDTILKPTLSWELQTDKPGPTSAEFGYVTGGMDWQASYNVIAPPKGNVLELVGWITLQNQTGKAFYDAQVKLMAGDVNKIQPLGMIAAMGRSVFQAGIGVGGQFGPPVTEKTFDEYHLYTLEHSTTLHDRETKQVEMVRAMGIQSKPVYVYDGFKLDQNYQNWPLESIRQQESYGTLSNPKVWVMQEFKNSAENHLGMPLPRGRVRFYRRGDDDGQLEFTGENDIDHTPKDETVRLYTGNAFDMTGERTRTEYRSDYNARWIDESFEIKVRNHKTTPVEVRIVEHLYRWTSWDIVKNSDPFKKLDSKTMEFTVQIPADGEKTVTYKVHYSW